MISTAKLEQFRDNAVNLIDQGKKLYSKGPNINIKKQGYDLMKIGCSELIQYAKEVTNLDYKNLARDKIAEYLDELDQMKEYLDSFEQPQGGQQNQIQDQNSQNNIKNQVLNKDLQNLIIKEKPKVKWEEIAGLEMAKQSLKEAVLMPIQFPNLFQGARKPWTGILLYGPPGTGKTFLAKACATECNGTFFSVSSADIISKYTGESEKSVKQLFQLAKEKKPSIIFIDEVDSLASERESSESSNNLQGVKNQLLIEFSGIGSDNQQVLVLGATNLPWGIDSAIRRRFEKRIYIPLPDYEGRLNLLKFQLRNTPNTLTQDQVEDLAQKLEGYSGSDINILIRNAALVQLRLAQEATHFKLIQCQNQNKYIACSASDPMAIKMTLKNISNEQLELPEIIYNDFLAVLPTCKPSVSQQYLKKYETWTEQFGQQG